MTTTTIVPGTEFFIDDVAPLGMPYSLPTDTITGAEPVLADGLDSTYITLGFVHGHPLGTDVSITHHMYGRLDAVTLTGTGLAAHFRTDQATTDVGATDPFGIGIGIFDKGAGFTDADFGATMIWFVEGTITRDSGFTDYSVDLTTPLSNPYGRSLDDLLALIAAGDAWVQLFNGGNVFSGFDSLLVSRVSEFYISDTEQPPLRQYPRGDDKAAVPASRVWPVPKSDTRVYSQEP